MKLTREYLNLIEQRKGSKILSLDLREYQNLVLAGGKAKKEWIKTKKL